VSSPVRSRVAIFPKKDDIIFLGEGENLDLPDVHDTHRARAHTHTSHHPPHTRFPEPVCYQPFFFSNRIISRFSLLRESVCSQIGWRILSRHTHTTHPKIGPKTTLWGSGPPPINPLCRITVQNIKKFLFPEHIFQVLIKVTETFCPPSMKRLSHFYQKVWFKDTLYAGSSHGNFMCVVILFQCSKIRGYWPAYWKIRTCGADFESDGV